MILRSLTVLVLWTAVSCAVAAAPHTNKPVGPLGVTIEPQGDANAETMTFLVTASSRISLAELKILVHPPGDMELVDGALQWTGEIHSGEPLTLTFTGRFSTTHRNRVAATVTGFSAAGERFAQQASYSFGDAGPAAARKPLGRQTERNGRRIVEIPLKGR